MDLAVGINHDAVYANYSMICLLQTIWYIVHSGNMVWI